MISLARERFFWPKMREEMDQYVKKVYHYLKQKKPNRKTRTPLQSMTTSAPFEKISIDYLYLEKSKGGVEYVLIIVDTLQSLLKLMLHQTSLVRQLHLRSLMTSF